MRWRSGCKHRATPGPPGVNNSELICVRAVVEVFEGEPGHQIINLLIQGPGVKGQNDAPVWVLGVPVGRLKRQDNRLAGNAATEGSDGRTRTGVLVAS